ncbi:MAG TPA: PEP/pyruvate-binding domain-containing protein [Nakamurella sp.]
MLGFLSALPTSRGDRELAAAESLSLAASLATSRGAAVRTGPPPAVRERAALATGALPLVHREIGTAEEFTALSVTAGDLVANGRVAKFLVDLRDPARGEVYFVNGNFTENGEVPESAKYHYFFARAALDIPERLEEFNRVTYFSPTKRYAAGVIHTYFLDGATDPVYALQFYPQDVVNERGVLDVITQVRRHITIPGASFAFVPTGTQQTTATIGDELTAAGIQALTIDRVLGSVRYVPLNAGEAWGYLRIFPPGNTGLTPADIPVFAELPLDLSVVAGVITKAVQDSNSHVNLKSKERGTPNMVLRDAGPDNERLAPWRDKPVHFVVRPDDFQLEASTDEEVATRLAERNNKPWIPLVWEPETVLRSYDEIGAGSPADALRFAKRYGSKAANIGFLAHRKVLGRVEDTGSASARFGYDLVPDGFGIPLSFYRNLVEHPANASLKVELDAFVEAEKAGTLSGAERARRVYDVQTCFLNAKIPPEDLAAVKAKLAEVLPDVKKVKIRSSANAEDVPNFDGAGLHDSFAATVTKQDNPDGSCAFEVDDDPGSEVKRKVSPKSVACAIKGVYASLWNQRAVEERTFARIDHATVAMGLSVVPAYDTESDVTANAVIVTRVLNTQGVYGYTLSVQDGNNLVTNPDPGTQTEVTVAALGLGDEPTSLTITRFAQPVAGGPVRTEPVLAREDMLALVDIAATVERAYCAAKPSYYEGDCRFVVVDNEKPTSVDMELKILSNGQFLCKQVREFGGR